MTGWRTDQDTFFGREPYTFSSPYTPPVSPAPGPSTASAETELDSASLWVERSSTARHSVRTSSTSRKSRSPLPARLSHSLAGTGPNRGLEMAEPSVVGEIATAINPVMALGRSIAGLVIGHDPLTLKPQSRFESLTAAALGQLKGSKVLGNVKFPSLNGLAQQLGVAEKEVHAIKKSMTVDLKDLHGMKNPDIGVDRAGNIAFKDRITGRTVQTDVPITTYGQLGE